MDTLITERIEGPHGVYVQASCGKVSALVSVHEWGLQVCCQNAANKVWRGAGKWFPSVPAALAGYKSAEMQNIIRAAVQSAQWT